MKQLALLITVLLFHVDLIGSNSVSDTLIVKTNIYCDHCAECEDCMPHIERELRFTAGVDSSSIDVTGQTITIYYNKKKTNPDKLRKAVANAGFDADDVKANPKAQARLDECCQRKD